MMMMLHSCSDWFGRQINISKRPVRLCLLLWLVILFVFLPKNLFNLCAGDHTQRALIFDPFFICLVLFPFVTSSLLAAATAAAVVVILVAELHQLLCGGQVRLCQGLVVGALMINIAT
ncbi:hypothetical protein RchiOBHm_Chr2g0119901 [Rosa chinensis]|uniref:Uncharacterized protein n=1 Tax=Rosa chinensis TaxID=74649 RepID=A0A2P6RS62_ROSCH|nr:hypothetical protein RchiOBHm_Chr2g0119901 [Rosa chinensis]